MLIRCEAEYCSASPCGEWGNYIKQRCLYYEVDYLGVGRNIWRTVTVDCGC